MNANTLILNDIKPDDITTYNFKKLLTKKDTIIWRNCSNLKIKINSKINKIIFENCMNIELTMTHAVIGIELNNCQSFVINIKKHLNSFESYKSTVRLNHRLNHLKTFFFCEKTRLIQSPC